MVVQQPMALEVMVENIMADSLVDLEPKAQLLLSIVSKGE
jgi:hypothetical protein